MWKKSQIWKSRKFRVLLIIEMILLLIGIIGVARGNRLEIMDEQMDISLNAGEYIADEGYMIDQSSGFVGSFLISSDFLLTPGVYELSVYYSKTGEDVASTIILNNNSTFYGFRSSLAYMFFGENICKSQFYVLEKSDSFQAVVNFGGTDELTVSKIEIVHTNAGSRIFVFLVFFVSIIINSLLMIYFYLQKEKVPLVKKVVCFSVLAITILASIPLFTDYIIIGKDSLFYLKRIEILADQLVKGVFPIRAIFLFIPAFLRIIGLPMLFSYGLFMFLINFLSSLFAFFCFKISLKNSYIGVLGSAVYTLAPYRINLIYKQAAIGELLTMIAIPILSYLFIKLFQKNNNKIVLIIVGLTVLVCVLFGLNNDGRENIFLISIREIRGLFEVDRMHFWSTIKNIGASMFVGTIAFLTLGFLQKKEVIIANKTFYFTGAFAVIFGGISILFNLQLLAVMSFTFATVMGAKIVADSYDIWLKNAYFVMISGFVILFSLYQTNNILLTTSNSSFIRGYVLDTKGYQEIIYTWYANSWYWQITATLCALLFLGIAILIIRIIKNFYDSFACRIKLFK